MSHWDLPHESLICATCLIHMCDMVDTVSIIQQRSRRKAECVMTQSYAHCHVLICATWLNRIYGMTHSYVHVMTHSYVGFDSFVCGTRINLNKLSLVNPRSASNQSSKSCTVRQYPSKKAGHESLICATCLIYMCDMVDRVSFFSANSGKQSLSRLIQSLAWLIQSLSWLNHKLDITHLCHDSLMCGTRLIDMCDMTHSYVRHDLFIGARWLIDMCDMVDKVSFSSAHARRHAIWLFHIVPYMSFFQNRHICLFFIWSHICLFCKNSAHAGRHAIWLFHMWDHMGPHVWPDIWTSHVEHMIESCRTYERVMLHSGMQRVIWFVHM